MSKRLMMLEQLTAKGTADSFAWYALAMEYSTLGRVDDALKAFATLRSADPGYVPQYLMCGVMLSKAGRTGEAQEWMKEGIAVARGKGDAHAQSEIETALAELESSLS
jgi:tetratricopeptide (TPR) repeat protein